LSHYVHFHDKSEHITTQNAKSEHKTSTDGELLQILWFVPGNFQRTKITSIEISEILAIWSRNNSHFDNCCLSCQDGKDFRI
jgi:hypothetical protein